MYRHTVQYYETDMMGITHHSNYIRFMEEARIFYLKEMGLDYSLLEQCGIISPILHVEFQYKKSTTFGDEIYVMVKIAAFHGVKLGLDYEMYNQKQELIGIGKSISAFLDANMKPIRMKYDFPMVYEILYANSQKDGAK